MSAVYKFLNSLDGKFDKAIGVPVRFEVWDFNKPPMREGIILSVNKEILFQKAGLHQLL